MKQNNVKVHGGCEVTTEGKERQNENENEKEKEKEKE